MFGFQWKSWPKKSNLSRFFSGLNKESVEDIFRECSQNTSSLKDLPKEKSHQIVIDGKVLRGSFDNLKDNPQLHLLSLFSVEDKIILGHVEISEKTNEIPTAQEIIKKLGLPEGAIYTLDALHCQKKTFEAVKEAKGNLVTQVKKNQKYLLSNVTRYSKRARPQSVYAFPLEKQRNRIEYRAANVFSIEETLSAYFGPIRLSKKWGWESHIKSVIRVERKSQILNTKEKKWDERCEVSYYIASYEGDAEHFSNIIRDHWACENRHHYVQDVALAEDASRIRSNPGAFARMRSFALNVLRSNGIKNIKGTLFENALNFNNILAYKGIC